MALGIQRTSYGEPAMHALRQAIDAAQGGRRLTPVTVVVASNSVGVAARRWLAAHGGIAAVQFVTIHRLAELLGGPALAGAGRRPVSNALVDVAVRRVLAESPGAFAPVAAHHATITALREAHRELRHVPAAELAGLARAGTPRAREVVRIHRRVERMLAREWYDEADLDAAAVAALAAAGGGDALLDVIVLLPRRWRPTEQVLLDELARRGNVHVIEGDPSAPITAPIDALDVSDADEEARESVRQVLAAVASGTTLERIAIVWPVGEPYARLVTEHLDAADVPWNGRPGIAVRERLASRLLLEVLALDRRGIRRGDLFAMLAHVPARESTGVPAPAQWWERLSRDAGIAGDADWDGRLAVFERALATDPKRTLDADAVARLRTFVAELRELLGDAAVPRPWAHWATTCRRLLDRWVGGSYRLARLPPEELDAHAAVEATLDRLGQLDRIDDGVTRATFLETFAAELDARPGRLRRLGEGVHVGPLSFAVGQSLDLVIVVGACEGSLPAAPPVEPLLDDGDRALTNGALPLSGAAVDEQHEQLIAAIGAARRAVVLRPRGDLRATTVRQPSRWIAELTTGSSRSVPSYAAGLADAAFPVTLTQHRVRALVQHVRAGRPIDEHPLASSVEPLRAGLALLRARQQPLLTEYDGDLSGVAIRSPLDGDSAISATRLENYSKCPFGYFVKHVLRIDPVEQPDLALQISALDRGTMLHETLNRFHRRVLSGELHTPEASGWSETHRGALLDELEVVAAEYAAAGLVGRTAFWEATRVRDRKELVTWLDHDGRRLVERGATLIRSEASFGTDDVEPAVITLSGGRRVLLRGQVDRIDAAGDGTIYVTDHKTGSTRKFDGVTATDPTASGVKLQLAAYAAAAPGLAGRDATDVTHLTDGGGVPQPTVHAEYSFMAGGKFQRIGATFTGDVWPAVGDVLARIVDGIEAGLFYALPDKSQFQLGWVKCEYCDPDHLGTAGRYAEMLAKLADPRLANSFGRHERPDG